MNEVDPDAEEEKGLFKTKEVKEVKRRRRYVPAKNRCGSHPHLVRGAGGRIIGCQSSLGVWKSAFCPLSHSVVSDVLVVDDTRSVTRKICNEQMVRGFVKVLKATVLNNVVAERNRATPA